MKQRKGSLLETILRFAVAALYAGLIAYVAIGVTRHAQGELLLARSKQKQQPAWLALAGRLGRRRSA